jgi:hypothetical protein
MFCSDKCVVHFVTGKSVQKFLATSVIKKTGQINNSPKVEIWPNEQKAKSRKSAQ